MFNRDDFETSTTNFGEDVPVCPECEHVQSVPDGHGFDHNQEMTWTCSKCKAEFLIERGFVEFYDTYKRKPAGGGSS